MRGVALPLLLLPALLLRARDGLGHFVVPLALQYEPVYATDKWRVSLALIACTPTLEYIYVQMKTRRAILNS